MSVMPDNIIIYLVMVPETIAVLVGAIRFKKLQAPLQNLWILVLFGFSTDLLSRVLIYFKIRNLFLISLYIPVEFGLLASIYHHELKGSRVAQTIPFLTAGFAGYAFFQIITGKLQGFSREERFVEGFLILIFVLQYLYRVMKKLNIFNLEYAPMFWLSTGLFIYFPCDIIIFIFSEYIFSSYSRTFNLELWNIHAVLTIILYTFYTLTLWISQKK
ncbi:hypothetical protein C7475_11447 [Chitinophaga sp. S165]|nr:hypothetical protein C7475_11447 [Chitinophaga sp. S165]